MDDSQAPTHWQTSQSPSAVSNSNISRVLSLPLSLFTALPLVDHLALSRSLFLSLTLHSLSFFYLLVVHFYANFIHVCPCPRLSTVAVVAVSLLVAAAAAVVIVVVATAARFAHIVKLSSQKLPLSRNILHGMQMKWNYFSAEFLLDLRSQRLLMIKRIAFIVFVVRRCCCCCCCTFAF